MDQATSLYVHVPFCVRKCRYCDFYSTVQGPELARAYLDALGRELRNRAPLPVMRTVYVGGGTPTSLEPAELSRLMQILAEATDLSKVREFTVEANPGTLNDHKLRLLRDAGVNRLSIGVQSLDPATLAVLGRIHTAQQSVQAVRSAKQAAFTNLSVDLIFAVPGQTLADVQADLDGILSLDVPHVSAYGLTYEERTPLWSDLIAGRLQPVTEEDELEMYRAVRRALTVSGYEHYEVSNFARPSFRSRHNQVYWRNEPYVGVGPGATSYIEGVRWTNARDVKRYIETMAGGGDVCTEKERLEPVPRARETLIMGLRMREGVALEDFARRTGFTIEQVSGGPLAGLMDVGLLEMVEGRLRLTDRGLEVADEVLSELV